MADTKQTYDPEIFGDNNDIPKIVYDECPWKQSNLTDWTQYFDDIDDSNDGSANVS